MRVLCFLKEMLHGKNPHILEVILVYLMGSVAGLFFVWQVDYLEIGLSSVEKLVLFLLGLDFVGGIISNATYATNELYKKKSLKYRFLALLLHGVQLLIVSILFNNTNWIFFVVTYIYMIFAGTIVLMISKSKQQKSIALGLFILGVVLNTYFFNPSQILSYVVASYFFKLIVSFSVDFYK